MISVIVTIYNREKYLDECLSSLKNQTYKNFEVLMIDDGSIDNSINIAKRYADEDNRFKLIQSTHIGFPAAKNLGLSKVSGDYIIFLDSDDSAYPQWLEFLNEAAEESGADISTCYYDEYIDDKAKKAQEPDSEFYKTHIVCWAEYDYLKMNLIYNKKCSSYLWNKLVRKNLYDGIVFQDQIALSDISEIYKIVDKANKVIQVQAPLVHYRRHMESIGMESIKSGLDYYKFRADVLEQSAKFIWEHYPQTRFAAQLMLQYELGRIKKIVGDKNYAKEIDREFFHKVFLTSTKKRIFRD